MKEQYYLVSQLPDISAAGEKSSLPITEKYYRDLCSRFFDARQNEILNKLSLEAPKLPESTGSVFLDKWYGFERALRYALAQVRAQKMKKDAVRLDVFKYNPYAIRLYENCGFHMTGMAEWRMGPFYLMEKYLEE